MMWIEIQKRTQSIGLAIGIFGLGVWADGIYNGTAKLPWLHQQAAELRAVKVVEIPKLKAAAHCEHVRANVSQELLEDAAKGAAPSEADIPADCPHPK